MLFFLITAALCVHVLLWGAGAALLLTPRRWRRCWPIWIAPCGLALQSLVVWAGAHTALAGTDRYAWWSEALPLALLAGGLVRRGGRAAGRDLLRFWALGVVMTGCLWLIAAPVAKAGRFQAFTTASIGSCDAADYAAGARVFKEFAAGDRGGFMGLTEVVHVGSTDNFFDFWLQLNHFTPSALIALNASVFGVEPWELTSALSLALVVLALPLVFWLARSGFTLSERAALWLAFIYGVSPVTWYAAYHVAPAQMLAAAGIALLTWGGLQLWRERQRPGAGRAYLGLLFVAGIILWGGYNFIIVVCLVPAVACAGGWTLASGEWAAFWRWLRRMLVPLGLAGILMPERVAGLAERFLLFQQTDFGWKIHALAPEGWLGMVGDTGLEPWENPWAWTMSLVTVALLAVAWIRLLQREARAAWRLVACVVPVLIGYGYLEWRGWRLDNNSSYDAYKLFAVFYPVLLVALCPWLRWLRGGRGWRWLAVAMIAVVTFGNLRIMGRFAERMGRALLIVEPDLVEVQRVESMPRVHSVNVIVPDFWARLWANSFLLRKAQYFPTHTYEGRLNTPLRGEWDFNGGMVQVKLPGDDWIKVNHRFSLARVASPYFVRASLGDGWYGTELLRARQTRWWNWTAGRASLELVNPHDRPLRVVLHFQARSLRVRDLQVWIGRHRLARARVGTELEEVTVPFITVQPGRAVVDLRSQVPPVRAGEDDPRLLGFAVYGIVVEVLPDNA